MTVEYFISLAREQIEQPREAVDALVEAWRACRDPEIAALIDAIALKVPHAAVEIRKRRVWDELLDRKAREHAADLIAALVDYERPWHAERIVRLCELAPDPRVVRAMEDLVETANEPDRPRIRARIAELSSPPIALEAGARAQLSALAAEWAARDRAETALLDEVYASPDDDGPRNIYGDWLQQRGDPRGDLIAAQVRRAARPRDEEARLREKKLVEHYARVWLGGLRRPNVVIGTYERGFVSSIALRDRSFDKLIGLREWATVRDLALRPLEEPIESLLAFLGHDAMRWLRSVGPLTLDELVAIAKLPSMRGLEQVTTSTEGNPGAAPNLAGLPNLVRLVATGGLEWLMRSELRERVQVVSGNWPQLRSVVTELLTKPHALEELRIHCGFDVRFVRGEQQLSKLVVKRVGLVAETMLRTVLRYVPDRVVGEYEVDSHDKDDLVRVIRGTLRLR